MQPLSKKLQLKPEQHLLALNAPDTFTETLQAEGCTVTAASAIPATGDTYDAVQVFVKDSSELNHFAPLAVAALKPGGMLWIAYPKKTSKVKTDLTRDEGWKTVAELGYAGVRQIAIDDTWSSLRFRHTSERKEPSTFGVDKPSIDRRARTVEIPQDLREALEAMDLLEVFEKLAFTHRKECVLAVQEAKRPETRASRIGKTIEQVLALSQRVKGL
ncbi:YdeI/OmpD-associated family protein [Pontibacter roseus]|uniref:YdeI/OmpD-associated family protein n=1 Tax=Pontibacter roseus TaxID=336989 RepID=UPI00037ADBFD|nr:YdeI/OmpD-associated family protein [Pontibacter roseus]